MRVYTQSSNDIAPVAARRVGGDLIEIATAGTPDCNGNFWRRKARQPQDWSVYRQGRLQVAVAQRTQGAFVVGPTALDLDPEVEHDLGIEQHFHVTARIGADALDALALVTNDDF